MVKIEPNQCRTGFKFNWTGLNRTRDALNQSWTGFDPRRPSTAPDKKSRILFNPISDFQLSPSTFRNLQIDPNLYKWGHSSFAVHSPSLILSSSPPSPSTNMKLNHHGWPHSLNLQSRTSIYSRDPPYFHLYNFKTRIRSVKKKKSPRWRSVVVDLGSHMQSIGEDHGVIWRPFTGGFKQRNKIETGFDQSSKGPCFLKNWAWRLLWRLVVARICLLVCLPGRKSVLPL